MTLWAPSLRARFLRPLGVAAVLVFLSGAAFAEETPFDLESSSWMSFDRYKDKPMSWLAPDQRATVAQQPVIIAPPVLPASMPNLTEPTRPIMTPVMPGLNKGFDVKVDTTEDSNHLPGAEATRTSDQMAPLQDNKWKDAVEAARQKELNKQEEKVDVRFASLPAWTVPQKKAMSLPVIAPAEKSAPALTPVKIVQPVVPPPPPAVKPADAAVCAALDAYKKRQLQAIQSDRETLTALQNAISQLGLQKQLDFMPGASGSMNMQAAGSPTTPSTKN